MSAGAVVEAYFAWQDAQAEADELRRKIVGRRVKHVGGVTGKVIRVSNGGFTVRWDDGRREWAHPSDLTFI